MSNIKALFLLEVIADNPIFEGFALDTLELSSLIGRECLEDDLIPGYEVTEKNLYWQVPRLSNVWQPPQVEGRVSSFNDYPGLNFNLPVFSKKAVEVLNEFLAGAGELLPLDTEVGEYFLFNITTVSDCLDSSNSSCEFWCDPPTTVVNIDKYVFKEDKLSGLSIFRVFEDPMSVIVTDKFVHRVKKEGLKGFSFKQIWSSTEAVSIGDNVENIESSTGMKANTLILLFNQFKETRESDLRKIKMFEDQIDRILRVEKLESTYYGCYEGSDSFDGSYRMFLSCPDVDVLLQKIEPWLVDLDWKKGIKVLKKYGELYDESSLYKEVSIKKQA